MEVRSESLEKLKCSTCNGYLSCGPVFQTEDSNVTCGRCPKPKSAAFRITAYEHLAEMLYFPCPNAAHGCGEKIRFSEQKIHDVNCDFRPITCVIEAPNCKWIGPRRDVREHCETKHPGKVLENPGCLKNNFNKNTIQTFLMSAFTAIFLIRTKLCLTRKQIMISISQLGDAVNGSLFSFQLDIMKSKAKITKFGSVIPHRQVTELIPATSATSIHVNSIVDIFGNLDGVTFQITIHPNCANNCANDLKQVIFHDGKGWFCTDCVPVKRFCRYHVNGCIYSDFDKKSIIHESHFCNYSTWCWICDENITFSLVDHRNLVHSSITHVANTTWSGLVNNNWQHCIVVSEIGDLLCSHWVNPSVFQLRIVSPLSSEQLDAYECVMILSNPATQSSVQKVADVIYNDTHDWLVQIDKDEFLSFVNNEEFDVKIQIIKKPIL